MHALSNVARFILERMEPDRHYEAPDLRVFVADASTEQLRELMHELWVNRQVERVGDSAWLRRPSAPPHRTPTDSVRQAKAVKPEDLFDHESFTDFFR
jgi:hypothetical protein